MASSVEKVDGMNFLRPMHPIMFKQRIDDIRLKRGEDVLLATYPRTGTTWVGQILSLMLAEEDKYEEVKKIPLTDRVLFLEVTLPGNDGAQITKRDTVPPPRTIKTHLTYRFMRRWLEEDNVKTVITTRNPKDALVSFFHHYRNAPGLQFNGTWADFFEYVKNDKVLYGDPYDFYLDWDKNKSKTKGEILFLKYEDLKQDIVSGLKQIAAFLDIKLSESHLQKVVHDTSLKQMKVDQAVTKEPGLKDGSSFVRKGVSGEWKKHFTVEQNEWFDNKYKKLYENLGIDVDYN